MLDLLHRRHDRVRNGDARRYAFAEHVASATGWSDRVADAMVMDLWESSGQVIHGFEVKCSRSDWLAELRKPWKAGAFIPFVDHWWLVASDPDIVRGDLPEGWGLMVPTKRGLRVRVRAPKLTPAPMPRTMLASFVRAVAKTSSFHALRSLP